MNRVSQAAEIPEGMSADARETWPSHDLIDSWLGDSMYDFQFRPGEDVVVDATTPRRSRPPGSSATCSAASPRASPW